MHELLAKIDDITYRRIIEDARMKGIDTRDWISHAINECLTRHQSAIKEVPACENAPCSPGALHVHAEIYTPHPDAACHDIIEQLQQQVRELEAERNNLQELLGKKYGPGSNFTGDEAEVLILQREIDKNAFELDEMEAALERLRLERDQVLTGPEGIHRAQHIEREIERQQYEVENFREEIVKIMSTRDSLRDELAKKRRG